MSETKQMMRPVLLPAITTLCLVILSVMLAFSIHNNRKMTFERKILILKNDSLHIREIKAKKELLSLQKQLDSLLGNIKNSQTKIKKENYGNSHHTGIE